jgi:hypothetical protein
LHVALPGPPGAEDSERLSGVCAREGVRAWCKNDVIGRRVLARERPRQVSGLTGGGSKRRIDGPPEGGRWG